MTDYPEEDLRALANGLFARQDDEDERFTVKLTTDLNQESEDELREFARRIFTDPEGN